MIFCYGLNASYIYILYTSYGHSKSLTMILGHVTVKSNLILEKKNLPIADGGWFLSFRLHRKLE